MPEDTPAPCAPDPIEPAPEDHAPDGHRHEDGSFDGHDHTEEGRTFYKPRKHPDLGHSH